MITYSEKWHYLAVKSLSAFFRGIKSKHDGDSYCLNCFQSYSTKKKLKKHKKVCENHEYCYVEMPEEDNKILKYNQGEKSMKVPFTTYADSSTTKINKHTPSGYFLFTHCSFDTTKNKLDYYRGKNCMKNFCPDLRKHATEIINYEKKEMIALTKEENKMHRSQKNAIYAKKDSVLIITIKI